MTIYHTQDAVLRHIGDERLLVPIKGRLADMQSVFTLNESSAFIWEKIQDGQDSDSIQRDLVERYGIPAEQAAVDCQELISTLLNEGLIFSPEEP